MNMLISLFLLPSLAFGQADCPTAVPYTGDCETFPDPWPIEVTRCYRMHTQSPTLLFNFLFTANCSSLGVTYTLHDDTCGMIASNTTGEFTIIPDTFYVICATVQCNTAGGIRAVCPYEEFTLPVEFLGAWIRKLEYGVELTWASASEHDAHEYIIARSRDGGQWRDLASLGSAVDSQHRVDYRWSDLSALGRMTYYRIDLTDIDGTRTPLAVLAISSEVEQGYRLGAYDLLGRLK